MKLNKSFRIDDILKHDDQHSANSSFVVRNIALTIISKQVVDKKKATHASSALHYGSKDDPDPNSQVQSCSLPLHHAEHCDPLQLAASSIADAQDGKNSKPARAPRKKPRKARTAFTDHQLGSLEQMFSVHKYIDAQRRVEIATDLELTDLQIKTWYQNRRTKWKRQMLLDYESLALLSRCAPAPPCVPSRLPGYNPLSAMIALNLDLIRASAAGSLHFVQ